MIGLCRGLAIQTYREAIYPSARYMPWVTGEGWRLFGFVPRAVAALKKYPLSSRYYQLLDSCPLRMYPFVSQQEAPHD